MSRARARIAAWLAHPILLWLGLLGLCAAYLQGGLMKLADFAGAEAELAALGVPAPGVMAAATVAIELGGSLLILTGEYRWLGALLLAGFTVVANLLANRFWVMPSATSMPAMNAFFEHLGLAGGFWLVAWHNLRRTGSS